MKEFTKPTKAVKDTAALDGTWTNVIGFSKVDGQEGIWLEIPSGDYCYYATQDSVLQNMVFTACANLKQYSIQVCLPANAPANGLIVGTNT